MDTLFLPDSGFFISVRLQQTYPITHSTYQETVHAMINLPNPSGDQSGHTAVGVP